MEKNILIGTPAYGNMLHTDYLHSIMDFHKNKIPITLMTLGNESLIPRGRNTIISFFYNNKDYTDLLFLDADMYLSAQGLVTLLQHEVDVIGAAVALKGKDDAGNSVYNVGQLLSDNDSGLIETTKVGTAIFLLSRRACEALCEDADTYGSNPHTRGYKGGGLQYDVFKTGVTNGEYDSEDYYVCRQLRELGFEINVDTTVQNRHNGNYVFT